MFDGPKGELLYPTGGLLWVLGCFCVLFNIIGFLDMGCLVCFPRGALHAFAVESPAQFCQFSNVSLGAVTFGLLVVMMAVTFVSQCTCVSVC